MTISTIGSAPLAAVQGATELGTRERARKPERPASGDAPPPQTQHAAAPAADAAVTKPVTLPEFPQYELSFRLDKERGRVVVQVIDSKSGTVVRTVPPEELGRALRRLPDARGVLLDRES